MTVQSYVVQEGTLTLGPVPGGGASVTNATAQVESVAVDWSEDVADDRPTLSGESLAGKAKYTATLGGTVIQDLTVGGLTEFTWTNKGKIVPFTLVPSGAAARAITGDVRISPLKVGGDVEEEPSSDFEWGCIGEPVLGDDLT